MKIPTNRKNRRIIAAIVISALMTTLLTLTCSAATTDVRTKVSEILKDVYSQIVTISSTAAVVTAAVALLLMNFSKNGKTVDERSGYPAQTIHKAIGLVTEDSDYNETYDIYGEDFMLFSCGVSVLRKARRAYGAS